VLVVPWVEVGRMHILWLTKRLNKVLNNNLNMNYLLYLLSLSSHGLKKIEVSQYQLCH
jgi:hypothetical protein